MKPVTFLRNTLRKKENPLTGSPLASPALEQDENDWDFGGKQRVDASALGATSSAQKTAEQHDTRARRQQTKTKADVKAKLCEVDIPPKMSVDVRPSLPPVPNCHRATSLNASPMGYRHSVDVPVRSVPSLPAMRPLQESCLGSPTRFRLKMRSKDDIREGQCLPEPLPSRVHPLKMKRSLPVLTSVRETQIWDREESLSCPSVNEEVSIPDLSSLVSPCTSPSSLPYLRSQERHRRSQQSSSDHTSISTSSSPTAHSLLTCPSDVSLSPFPDPPCTPVVQQSPYSPSFSNQSFPSVSTPSITSLTTPTTVTFPLSLSVPLTPRSKDLKPISILKKTKHCGSVLPTPPMTPNSASIAFPASDRLPGTLTTPSPDRDVPRSHKQQASDLSRSEPACHSPTEWSPTWKPVIYPPRRDSLEYSPRRRRSHTRMTSPPLHSPRRYALAVDMDVTTLPPPPAVKVETRPERSSFRPVSPALNSIEGIQWGYAV